MIAPKQWQLAGIWGDENTPDLSFQKYQLFGTRVSPLISLFPAVEALGEIGSMVLWWSGNFPKDTGVKVYARLDGESGWNQVEKGQPIPGISSGLAVPESRSVQVRIVLWAVLSEVNPDLSPEFDELILVAYRGDEEWRRDDLAKLVWSDEA